MKMIKTIGNFFDGFKISGKLSMICASFALPIAVLLYLMIAGINYNIRFAALEYQGGVYQRPLERLLQLIPDSQFLASRALDEKTPKLEELVLERAAAIDKSFADLEEADRRYGADLQFDDEGLYKRKRLHYRVATVKGEWENLKKSLADGGLSVKDSDEKHWHLNSDIRTMITHMGDTSFLILDPDLDTYYIMSATLLSLPQTQERIAHIRDEVWHMLKRGNLSQDQRIKVATYAALLKTSDFNATVNYANTALVEDPNFFGVSISLQSNIPPALKGYSDKTQPLLDALNRIALAPGGIGAEEFAVKASTARDAAFALWDTFAAEEDVLLNIRMDSFRATRRNYLMYTLIAVLFSLSIAFMIARNIIEPLEQCARALQSRADMDFSRRLEIERDDEFGRMGGGINKVSDAVRSVIHDILRISKSLTESAISFQTHGDGNPAGKTTVDCIKSVLRDAADLQKLGERFKL